MISMCCPNSLFIKSTVAYLKIAEIVLGYLCMYLIQSYGVVWKISLGSTVDKFYTTSATCSHTTLILFLSYLTSSATYSRIRTTRFEWLFNGIAALMYLSCSLYIVVAVHTYAYPIEKITSFFFYPVVDASYMIGFILVIIHSYDSYLSFFSPSISLPI